jgi:hypothetical protein
MMSSQRIVFTCIMHDRTTTLLVHHTEFSTAHRRFRALTDVVLHLLAVVAAVVNEQVMYWLAAASNRPQISDPMMAMVDHGGINGGIWMLHNYWKIAVFDGAASATSPRSANFRSKFWPQLVGQLVSECGGNASKPGKLRKISGTYHVVGCSSPEYNCYAPFEDRMCHTTQDCNYEISQLRWGMQTVLDMKKADPSLASTGLDFDWFQNLLDGALAW